MLRPIILSAFLIVLASACDPWPNTTETKTDWWQCSTGPIIATNVNPVDKKGKPEYPILLTEPLLIRTTLNNPKSTYSSPGLKQTILVAQWNIASCKWSNVPTFGLLTNIDACTNGVPCPIKPGMNQVVDFELDFSDTPAIIGLLKNDKPYQLTYILNDDVSKEQLCLEFQARALTQRLQ